tara:strand:+ start:2423 stop:5548 length:3126 start_codon:yes stop_codon:yes gene_type:complete
VQYTSVGSAGPYSFSFAILDEGDLAVYDATTLKTLTTHYEVSITPSTGTGSITFTGGNEPTSGNIVTIISDQAVARTSDFTTAGDYRAATINDELDRITIIQQQLESLIRRVPQINVFSNRDVSDSGAGPLAFPYGSTAAAVTAQADAFIKFDALGTSLETSATGAAQSLAGDGTEALPYYSYSADPNSGAWRVGADQLGWSVGGTKGLDLSTTGLTVTGTLDVGGDTSAGDNAAMGYTAAEGLILTGQGSTNDVTIKNDADAIALEVPTGTQNVNALGNLTVTGNFQVNGTTTTIATTNVVTTDFLIELNNTAASNANDMGVIMERGSTGDNAAFIWDESGDYFQVGTTTATGASTGNLTVADAQFHAAGLTLSGTSSDLGTVTTIDIDGGTVDGAVVGGASAAAVTGTTVTGVSLVASQDLALATGATVTGIDNGVISTGSATLLATQGAIDTAINSSSKAAGISMTWETTTTDTDQGVGKVWANHGTLSSATVLYFDDVERNSVSINALIDSLDDPTASNSATIYIQEAGTATAGAVFAVSGNVVSASSYSKVSVTHVATFGTLSDGDVVGVTFAFSGDDGGGMANVVEDTTPQLGGFLDANSKFISHSQGAAIASVAGDTDIWANFDGNTVHITGTNAITDFGTPKSAGDSMWVIFDGAASVVDSATITVVGNANFQAAANDMAIVYALTTSTFLFVPLPNAGFPTGSIADDAITLSKLAAGTDGELITWDASGDPAAVAVGTATHVLTSNGAGSAPTFQAASSQGKNLIINGGFQVNQRAYVSTTNTADGTYMHDRWRSGSADSSYTFSVASPASPQTITIAANDSIEQVIEGANVGTAGTHTISWTGTATARAVVNTQSMSGNFAVSPITVTAVLNQVITIQFTGADAAGGSTEATDTGTLGKVQCELGSASDFEHRDYASELARCSRYFFQYNQNTGPYQREHWGTHNVSTTQSDVAIQYPVAMRTAPTFSTGASVDDWRINGASCSAIPATVNVIHEAACRVRFTVASGLVLNEAAFIDARVAGAKLVFDAEL